MRNLLKLIPVALLALILLAGCSKTAPQPPNTNVTPPPVKVDPTIMIGASNATLRFLNSSLGWVAVNFEAGQTPHGIIIHTSDGGATWVKLNAPGLAAIRDLAFTDATHGWALTETDAGSNKTLMAIMATADGGQTWAQQWQQELPQPGRYREQFFNAQEGFVLAGGSLLATVDGGATWVQRGAGQALDSFSFSDHLTGWATGSNSIWHTADGGATWAKQWTVPDKIKGEFIYSAGVVSFVSPTSGWALFEGDAAMHKTAKLVLYTGDGGSNWSVASAFVASIPNNFPDAPHYTMARFVPLSATTTLFASSPPTDYPVLYRTADHGVTWETLSDGMSNRPGLPKGTWGDLNFTSDSEGWAAVITQANDQAGNPDNSVALLQTQDGGKTWTSRFP